MEIFPLSQYLSRILIQDWAIELYRGCLAEETENQHFWLNLLHKNLNITIDQVEKYHWRMTALLAIQLDYTVSFNASCEGAAGLVAAHFHPEQASPSAGLLEAKLCRRVLLPLERHLKDFTCTPLYVYFYSLLVRSLLRHLEKHFPEGVSVFK